MSAGNPSESTRPDGFALAVFVLLVMAWGLNWPSMKIGVSEIPILSFRAIGSLLAVVVIVAITLAAGHSLKVPKGKMLPLAIAGTFNIGSWLLLSAIGVSMIGAGRAALIAYTMPVWAFLLGIPMLGERVSASRLAGLALAMGGLALMISEDMSAVGGGAPYGILVMIGAAWSLAFGTVWQKRIDYGMPHLSVTTWQLIWGTAPIVIVAIPELPSLQPVSWQAMAATVYTGVFAQVIGITAYLWLVKRLPLKVSSLSVLLVPLVGLCSSALILGERLTWVELGAAGLVFAAIATAFAPEKRARD